MEIVTLKERKALIISDSLGMFKLAKAMGAAYPKIKSYLDSNNVIYNSAPFTSYVVDNWEKTVNMSGFSMVLSVFTQKWIIEMGYEIEGELENKDDMTVITLPSDEYIETMHIGPYQKVGDTYKKIYAFSEKGGRKLGGKSYEYYLNDPKETSKEKLETRVLVPLL